ncbi:hypothetical protein SPRG_06049 [Saprolegnia parasitica CBS 223.65]|uniref:Peptidase C1A papain C-terminal domain-containing protein n=1 Tax=Saprolegnia parasitica (strain CBS 223.65) TaxID=695850 RepID=A0A067CEL0_SAPPC|nr:hypothetical protein SPRG_06049 [Saprolegnia parasitica CBS 223.65]KDO28948.1 hypothetical protein SPRG_06049 [Saprolegnia parasitica CBS 223.65]|eukprot:XP_012200164.1 hypothetical protein SPRG_06049 [Saprolegnia parasitica CBS 223.65]
MLRRRSAPPDRFQARDTPLFVSSQLQPRKITFTTRPAMSFLPVLLSVAAILAPPLSSATTTEAPNLSGDERDELSRDLTRWQKKFGNDDHVRTAMGLVRGTLTTDDLLWRLKAAKDELPTLRAANPYATFSHLTKFALLTDIEFAQFASSPSPVPPPVALPAAATLNRSAVGGIVVSVVDWTKQSVCVAPAKWIGKCRSDWAIMAAAAVSSAHCLATGEAINLSVQQVLSCTYMGGSESCSGPGTPFDGMQWLVRQSSALCTGSAIPYTSGHSGVAPFCSDNAECAGSISLQVGVAVEARGEAALEKQLQKQPVVAYATTNNYVWRQYTGGLLSWCPSGRLDQAVLVVGFGTEDFGFSLPPTRFFKVRNAWGPDWGENGDIRLARGPGAGDFSPCNITSYFTYPTLQL